MAQFPRKSRINSPSTIVQLCGCLPRGRKKSTLRFPSLRALPVTAYRPGNPSIPPTISTISIRRSKRMDGGLWTREKWWRRRYAFPDPTLSAVRFNVRILPSPSPLYFPSVFLYIYLFYSFRRTCSYRKHLGCRVFRLFLVWKLGNLHRRKGDGFNDCFVGTDLRKWFLMKNEIFILGEERDNVGSSPLLKISNIIKFDSRVVYLESIYHRHWAE